MENLLYIITGTNRGLGEAFVKEIFSSGKQAKIISVGRKLSDEQEKLQNSSQFYFAKADLADPASVHAALTHHTALLEESDHIIFINNAATISPIEQIGSLDESKLVESVNINATSPAVLANYILRRHRDKRLTFLNVTSGAAGKAISGWAAYCSGKAFAKTFFSVLQEQEIGNSRVKVFQIDPGTLDTEMQVEIRNSNPITFPRQNDFIELKEKGMLKTPEEAAKRILTELSAT